MRRFVSNLLDGMGHINMFPDPRSVDEILAEYNGNHNKEMQYMMLGFVLLVAGMSVGLCLIIMSSYHATGVFLLSWSIAMYFYTQVRRMINKTIRRKALDALARVRSKNVCGMPHVHDWKFEYRTGKAEDGMSEVYSCSTCPRWAVRHSGSADKELIPDYSGPKT